MASGPKAGIQDGSVSDYRGIYRGIWTRPSDGGLSIHHLSNTAGPMNANIVEPLLSIPTGAGHVAAFQLRYLYGDIERSTLTCFLLLR